MTRELVLIGFSESTENQAALLSVIQGGSFTWFEHLEGERFVGWFFYDR